MKARVTTVSLGEFTFEALATTNPQGQVEYFVTAPSLVAKFELSKVHASRNIKALLGKDSKLSKVKSEKHPSGVSVISADDFSKVVIGAVKAGHPNAARLAELLIGLSTTQLIADAFGDKFNQEERDAYIQARLSSKQTRRTFTDRLKEYGVEASIDYAKATLDVYRLAGVQYTKTSNFRDKLPQDNLKAVERIEETLARLMANGKTYSEAVYFYKVHLA